MNRIIPGTMGIVPDVKANLGKAKGHGVDMEFNYEKSFNKDLWMTGRATFTYATSEAVEWEEPDYSATPLVIESWQIIRTGMGIYSRTFVY